MRRLIRGIVFFIAWVLPFHLIIRFFLEQEAWSAYWKEGLISMALFAIAGRAIRGLPERIFRGVPVGGILLFASLGVAWVLARQDRVSFYGFAGYTIYIGLFLVILYAFDRPDIRLLIGWLIGPAVIVAVGGIVQLATSDTMFGLVVAARQELAGADKLRIGSFLGSSIVLAPYLAMTALLTIAAAMATRSTFRRVAAMLATAVVLYALVNTWTRGGWLQLMFGLGIFTMLMVFFGPGRATSLALRRIAMAAVVVLCAVPLVFATFDLPVDTEVFAQRLSSTIDFKSDRGNMERLRAWSATWEYIGRSPAGLLVGIGPGEGWYFASAGGFTQSRFSSYMASQGLPAVTESYWFLLFLNYGVVGVTLFAYIYLSMLWRGLRALRKMTDKAEFIYYAAVLANLGSIFLELSWLQSLTSIYLALQVWTHFGILLIGARFLDDAKSEAPLKNNVPQLAVRG